MSMSSSLGKLLTGFFLGSLLGAIIGMLLSPRSGKETREMIKNGLDERYENSAALLSSKSEQIQAEVKAKATAFGETLSDVTSELEEVGRKTVNHFIGRQPEEADTEATLSASSDRTEG